MAERVHERSSRGPQPIVMNLPPVDLPPIVIDAGPRAPGLSGGRGFFKRLVVACDGTWLNSDNGMENGKLPVPSNVTRLSRAIKAVSQDGVPQIVNYHFGVGSQGNVIDKFISGTTGEGLGDSVREAYSFLANNYHPGDEIFLLGFSRGAFTARSIAGLIGEIGLLTKKGLSALPEVHKDVQHSQDADYVPKNPDIPFPNKPSAASPRYADELERRGLTRLGIPIKAIGVFDTVGSLGMPRVGWLTKFGIQGTESKEMSFFDTKLSNCIENAFQALALDERRSSFSPAVWEKAEGNKTTLRQVWFPGAHSNVGGGYDDQQIANITLAWMMSQLEPFLDMRDEFLLEQDEESERYYRRRGEEVRPWAFGEVYNSVTGLYALGGGTFRTPGLYHAVDPTTHRTTARPLRQTNEYIHPSVRARLRLSGPGISDKGVYDARALTSNYRLVIDYTKGATNNPDPTDPDIFWKLKARDADADADADDGGAVRILPEAPLWRLERELCKRDPKTYDYVKHPPPTGAAGREMREREREKRKLRREEKNKNKRLGGLDGGSPREKNGRRDRDRDRDRDSHSHRDSHRDREREKDRGEKTRPLSASSFNFDMDGTRLGADTPGPRASRRSNLTVGTNPFDDGHGVRSTVLGSQGRRSTPFVDDEKRGSLATVRSASRVGSASRVSRVGSVSRVRSLERVRSSDRDNDNNSEFRVESLPHRRERDRTWWDEHGREGGSLMVPGEERGGGNGNGRLRSGGRVGRV